MNTKIVLNKKNAKDDFGIITTQSFSAQFKNGKKKKSLGIMCNPSAKKVAGLRSKPD